MRNYVSLSFAIWDFNDINHDDLVEKIALIPDKVYIKGNKKHLKSNAVWEENGLIFHAPNLKFSSFEEQMESFLGILEERVDVLHSICSKYHCEFSCAVFIYFDNGESTPSIHLNNRYNNFIQKLDVKFDLDLYILSNE